MQQGCSCGVCMRPASSCGWWDIVQGLVSTGRQHECWLPRYPHGSCTAALTPGRTQADGGAGVDRKGMLRAAGRARAAGAPAVRPRFQQGGVDEVCFLGAHAAGPRAGTWQVFFLLNGGRSASSAAA